MSFEMMALEVSTNILARARLPSVAYKVGNEKCGNSSVTQAITSPEHFYRINMIAEAFTDFVEFMRETISEREEELAKLLAMSGDSADINEFVRDVLGRLVGAKTSSQSLVADYMRGSSDGMTIQ
jgi:hypothetical protein